MIHILTNSVGLWRKLIFREMLFLSPEQFNIILLGSKILVLYFKFSKIRAQITQRSFIYLKFHQNSVAVGCWVLLKPFAPNLNRKEKKSSYLPFCGSMLLSLQIADSSVPTHQYILGHSCEDPTDKLSAALKIEYCCQSWMISVK